MKTIGLIGGMSWESSIEYYRLINEGVKARCGGLHSAQSLMYSVDFAEIAALQHEGRWQEAAAILAEAAQRLERGGADFVVLCTNTMHKVADAVANAVRLPFLHIAQPTAQAIQNRGFKTVGLLATQFTMEQEFYKGLLTEQYGLHVLVPPSDDRAIVHRIIYDELCLGVIKPESKAEYVRIMSQLGQAGAEAIILGCTEIELLIKDEDSELPLFDTTKLHAKAAVDYALAGA